MKKRLRATLSWTQALLDDERETDWDAACRKLERWILYFQQERLIHLIVTVSTALLAMLALLLLLLFPGVATLLLFCLLFLLTVPYLFHYYALENGVQALYDRMDQMQERLAYSRMS